MSALLFLSWFLIPILLMWWLIRRAGARDELDYVIQQKIARLARRIGAVRQNPPTSAAAPHENLVLLVTLQTLLAEQLRDHRAGGPF